MAPVKEIKKRQCLTCFNFYEPSKRCKRCFWVGQRLSFEDVYSPDSADRKFFFGSHPWNSIDVTNDNAHHHNHSHRGNHSHSHKHDNNNNNEAFDKTQCRQPLQFDTSENGTPLPNIDEHDHDHVHGDNHEDDSPIESPLDSPKIMLKQWITVNERFDHIVRQKRTICNNIADHYKEKIELTMPKGAEFNEDNKGRLKLQIPVGQLAELMADVCDLWDVQADVQPTATSQRRSRLQPSAAVVERE
uniref:DUF2470 domain-containing protein n=1 Tax=Panagrellus redivivus TaxID=6233 RepID=A0A7E4VN22_PANRE